MTEESILPQFVDCAGGRIFLLLRRPAIPTQRHCVLFVPPFAEEMNKCRRQMAVTARALVDKGLSVLTVDLWGTGDSEGEFATATWEIWKANIATAVRWAHQIGVVVEALVGIRLGCALAAESLRDAGLSVRTSVFWQPVDSGRQFMSQFLRLRVAASIMTNNRETVDGLRAMLRRGEPLEVAGYTLSPQLWEQVERVELSGALDPCVGCITLVELGRSGRADLSAAAQSIVAAAVRNGLKVAGARVPDEPFWSTTEIVVSPTVTSMTVQSLIA